MPKRKPYNKLKKASLKLYNLCDVVLLLLCLTAPILIIFNIGFPVSTKGQETLNSAYKIILIAQWVIFTIIGTIKFFSPQSHLAKRKVKKSRKTLKLVLYLILSLLIISIAIRAEFQTYGLQFLQNRWAVAILLIVISTMVISRWVTSFLGQKTSPPLILASSFFLLIMIGSMMLMLPKATLPEVELSYTDALFISTSATCVTGLSTVDISNTFSTTGQVMILILIQIGGLGVMTLTSFFGMFFASSKFSGQMVVGDILSTSRMSELARMLLSIVIVTLSIELIGAIFLYNSIMTSGEFTSTQGWWFAIFHSVSAFCNAGFSTLSENLAEPVLKELNTVRWVVGILVIFGGISFPIFSDFIKALGAKFRNTMRRIFGIRPKVYPRIWRLNTYIVVRMTIALLLISWTMFLILEWDATLSNMTLGEKLSQSFLMATTPRTAGFNGVNMGELLPTSILLTTLLMWIGGAPQSTAGGIKVTTAYIAIKNIISSNQGTGDINVRYRRIPQSSTHRAFSVITLSITVIMISVFILSIANPNLKLSDITFEVISALSTVGLSTGVTAQFSEFSKYLLIALMFAGRVGVISLVIIFIGQSNLRSKPYSYPDEDILIT